MGHLVYQCDEGEFAHAGDFGDIIYSLAAVRAWCRRESRKARYYLFDLPGTTTFGMDPSRAESMLPLLRAQGYIEHAEWKEGRVLSNLNGFRDHERNWKTIAGWHLGTLGMTDHTPAERRWLDVPGPRRAAPVVFARSVRYKSHDFPWAKFAEAFGRKAVFVGTREEHADWCREHGPVPRADTPTLLDVAKIIAGADLFIGNQSSPFAIAEGLKKPAILEPALWADNCTGYGSCGGNRHDMAPIYPGQRIDCWRLARRLGLDWEPEAASASPHTV